jgi:hypothetical protein
MSVPLTPLRLRTRSPLQGEDLRSSCSDSRGVHTIYKAVTEEQMHEIEALRLRDGRPEHGGAFPLRAYVPFPFCFGRWGSKSRIAR